MQPMRVTSLGFRHTIWLKTPELWGSAWNKSSTIHLIVSTQSITITISVILHEEVCWLFCKTRQVQ